MMSCPLLVNEEGLCDWCAAPLTGRRTRWCSRRCNRDYVANHRWTQAKQAAKAEAAHYQCARCRSFVQYVEVNHIIPCKGKHGTFGCHHHLDNLEVLCKPCHRAVTAEQRENGAFK